MWFHCLRQQLFTEAKKTHLTQRLKLLCEIKRMVEIDARENSTFIIIAFDLDCDAVHLNKKKENETNHC